MAKLHLVKSDFEKLEKRVLPRFPFCYLTFKCGQTNQVFEVKDISHSGMQLVLRSGEHSIKQGANIHGQVHWNGAKLDLNAGVKWVTSSRLGVEFTTQTSVREAVDEFLTIDHFIKNLKPIHELQNALEIPAKLKYWLRSDGPAELFVWQHAGGELSHFQLIVMEHFVEWVEVKGLKTGRVISKRDIDTPLINEDEFVFKIDDNIDDEKLKVMQQFLNKLNDSCLDQNTLSFIKMKLSV